MPSVRLVSLVLSLLAVPLLAFAQPAAAPTFKDTPPTFASRVVTYGARDVVPLRAQVRFTTMIVLPVGEQILEATCGDKELWLVNATQNFAYVKPAKPGSQTNLNLLTSSGTVYSFVLTEVSGTAGLHPDVKVYVEPGDEERSPTSAARPLFVSVQQVEEFRAQAELAREDAKRARQQVAASEEAARRTATEAAATLDQALTAYRSTYPTQLTFAYQFPVWQAPFYVRAVFHDATCTYIQAGARELPALYELNESGVSLVAFEYRNGTYVVPKILDRGYLAIGKARLYFKRVR
jgi:type IV secretory pathway VirB9-like protein